MALTIDMMLHSFANQTHRALSIKDDKHLNACNKWVWYISRMTPVTEECDHIMNMIMYSISAF